MVVLYDHAIWEPCAVSGKQSMRKHDVAQDFKAWGSGPKMQAPGCNIKFGVKGVQHARWVPSVPYRIQCTLSARSVHATVHATVHASKMLQITSNPSNILKIRRMNIKVCVSVFSCPKYQKCYYLQHLGSVHCSVHCSVH